MYVLREFKRVGRSSIQLILLINLVILGNACTQAVVSFPPPSADERADQLAEDLFPADDDDSSSNDGPGIIEINFPSQDSSEGSSEGEGSGNEGSGEGEGSGNEGSSEGEGSGNEGSGEGEGSGNEGSSEGEGSGNEGSGEGEGSGNEGSGENEGEGEGGDPDDPPTADPVDVPVRFDCTDSGTKKVGSNLLKAVEGVHIYFYTIGDTTDDDIDLQELVYVLREDALGLRDGILQNKILSLPGDVLAANLPTGFLVAVICDARSDFAMGCSDLNDLSKRYSRGVLGPLFGETVFLIHDPDGGILVVPGPDGSEDTLVLYNKNDKDDDRCDENHSPLMIDLGNNGVPLSHPRRGATFDINADGVKDRVSWPLESDDVFLALDLNQNGRIDSGAELFGNYSWLPDGSKPLDGFEALAFYDTYVDSKINANDEIFSELVVWADKNRDGRSQRVELRSLAEANVLEIDLGYLDMYDKDQFGNITRQRSTITMNVDPSENPLRTIFDIWLSTVDRIKARATLKQHVRRLRRR